MPVVLRYKGYKFFFFSNEGNPLEPVHIHVRRAECRAKFWLLPEVVLDEAYGFNSSELNELLQVIEEDREQIERCWHERFDSQV